MVVKELEVKFNGERSAARDIYVAIELFLSSVYEKETVAIVFHGEGGSQITVTYKGDKNYFELSSEGNCYGDRPSGEWKPVKAIQPRTAEIGWALVRFRETKANQLSLSIMAGKNDCREIQFWIDNGTPNIIVRNA